MQIVFILLLVCNMATGTFLDISVKARDDPGLSNLDDLRTRQSIIWSCLATIFACTWVAIHPNLPDPRCSNWSQFKHRVAMMILTIFAPEFILIWALRQRIGARCIMKEYNNTVLGCESSEVLLLDITDVFLSIFSR